MSTKQLNHTHHSLLKIMFVSILALVMTSGLAAALMLAHSVSAVDTQASVKKGVVVVNLQNETKTLNVSQAVTVAIKINSHNALVNNARFGIRFQNSHVRNITFKPLIAAPFKTTSGLITSGGDIGINVGMAVTDPKVKSKALADGTVIGYLTFVPTSGGPLNIYFDPNLSHVYSLPVTTAVTPLPSPKSTTTPTARPGIPGGDDRTTAAGLIGEPRPGVLPADLLQTPANLILNVVGPVVITTPISSPTPVPVILCNNGSQCPVGYVCVQPTMPPCPKGAMCAEVMPPRRCEKNGSGGGTGTPVPTPWPSPYVYPYPTAYPKVTPTPSPVPTSHPLPTPPSILYRAN